MTINGRIAAAGAENRYRFQARKGEPLVIEVNARRLGSDLDSAIEVLDAKGNPIERAVVRPVWQTNVTLRDHDSAGRGIRIAAWDSLQAGDYVMIGGEILRVEALPLSPGRRHRLREFRRAAARRYSILRPRRTRIDSAVYKVQIHPPGTKLSPNGLPVAHLYYRNDDGGPGYGARFAAALHRARRRRVHSSASAIRRGCGGDDYRVPVDGAPAAAGFPADGRPAESERAAGRRGAGDRDRRRVWTDSMARSTSTLGRSAGRPARRAGHDPPGTDCDDHHAERRCGCERGRRHASESDRQGGRALEHVANPEDRLKLIALMPRPDLTMTAETKEVTLEPGGTAEITVSIARQGEFRGRVPVEVRNLPPHVRVLDVGLNGVLITEDESRRSFTLEALPSAAPGEQMIYVSGQVETRSGQQSSYAAPEGIRLVVKPKIGGGVRRATPLNVRKARPEDAGRANLNYRTART